MIQKMPVVLVCLAFILNAFFIGGPAHCFSDTSVGIHDEEAVDFILDHSGRDRASGSTPFFVNSVSSDEYAIQPCNVYGVTFGPYTKEGQDPVQGYMVSEEQIRELLGVIAPYTEWIVNYGSTKETENLSHIPHELGFKNALGAWLSDNVTSNAEHVASLINVSLKGDVDLLIVGGEVLWRNDLSEDQLIAYIKEVKRAVPNIPVATTDVYHEFLRHPEVLSVVDVVMATYYPYWFGAKIDYGVYLLHLWHRELVDAAGGIPVFVAETGWPSEGQQVGEAVPSLENASFYFLNVVSWAKAENVSYFYFEAFDEPWKAGYQDGPAGAHWGVWDKEAVLKPGMARVFNGETVANNWDIDVIEGPGDPGIECTVIPRFGSLFEALNGRVVHVKPGECRVVVYTLDREGWWSKPSLGSPRTIIWPDGNWTCMITPGKAGALATQIIAYLVPYEYYPPILAGDVTLPVELDEYALAKVVINRPRSLYGSERCYFSSSLFNFIEQFPLLTRVLHHGI